jgi:predicted aconitase
VTDVVCAFVAGRWPIRTTCSAAASEGKKTEEGTMMSWPESNTVAVANPPEEQTMTPATTERASDIMTNRKL